MVSFELQACRKIYSLANKIFSDFLLAEMNKRDWTQSDLARAAGLSRATLSNILNNVRFPGKVTCRAIAHALRLPPEEIFREAGLLPPKKPRAVREEMILYLADQLPDEEYEELVDYINYRLDRAKGKGKVKGMEGAK